MVRRLISCTASRRPARSISWLAPIVYLVISAATPCAAAQFSSQGKMYDIEAFAPPGGTGKAKIVMIVHGSAGLMPPFLAQFQGLGKRLAAQGYFVVLPNYFYMGNPNQAGLDPKIHLKTLADALEYATKQSGVDDQNIALVGFSLGGALSLALAESDPTGRIKALVDFYGPTDPNILGGAAKLPPTLILHNSTDGIVLISSSQDLDAALGKHLIPHRFQIYAEHNPDPMMKDHPFAPNGPADKDSQEQTIKWLAEYLRP